MKGCRNIRAIQCRIEEVYGTKFSISIKPKDEAEWRIFSKDVVPYYCHRCSVYNS